MVFKHIQKKCFKRHKTRNIYFQSNEKASSRYRVFRSKYVSRKNYDFSETHVVESERWATLGNFLDKQFFLIKYKTLYFGIFLLEIERKKSEQTVIHKKTIIKNATLYE